MQNHSAQEPGSSGLPAKTINNITRYRQKLRWLRSGAILSLFIGLPNFLLGLSTAIEYGPAYASLDLPKTRPKAPRFIYGDVGREEVCYDNECQSRCANTH